MTQHGNEQMREAAPAPAAGAGGGRDYWRSLDELADTAEFRNFLEREFPAQASEWIAGLTTATRRGFLGLMGASFALAGLAGCRRWPEEKLAPYAHRPANRTDGMPVHYATAMEVGGIAEGLLVTSYDGRPIKIEGNPTHPLNRGATSVLAQAAVLGVYDPDRSRGVRQAGQGGVRWEDFAVFVKGKVKARGLWILTEATRSPSVEALRARLVRAGMPAEQWVEYEAWSDDASRMGVQIAHGRPLRAVPELDKARVILAVDADLFGCGEPLAVKFARDFAAGRREHDDKRREGMNRLWCVESVFSNTGAAADHRRALAPSAFGAFLGELAGRLGVAVELAGKSGVDAAFLDALAADLMGNEKKAVLVAGPRLPAAAHALVAAINARLGAPGNTLTYYADQGTEKSAGQIENVKRLVAAANGGQVETLLIIGGNPVYNMPADVGFAGALGKVGNTIRLGMYEDETSALCGWHVSQTHFLEAWGDARTFDGTVSLVQPLIEPLFEGKSAIEVLALLLGGEAGGYEIVRETARALLGAGFSEWAWKQALVEGVFAGTAWPAATAGDADVAAVKAAMAGLATPAGGGYELVFTLGNVHDGRGANNGWLQELPDPMTRITWDNAALVSPKTATALGVARDGVVKISANGREVEVAAYALPGMADNVIGLALGYGRKAAGAIGTGVGVNAYGLRTAAAVGSVANVTVQATGRTAALATVQLHNIIDAVGEKALQRRVPELVKEATFAEFEKDAAVGNRKVVTLSLWNEHKFDGTEGGAVTAANRDKRAPEPQQLHKWGMAIDLSSCTGCSACVVACQAENNIPIVGKEQVLLGREMQWLRIDRYFRNKDATPDPTAIGANDTVAVHQPVMCVHCENAPCESVCPVAATTHSSEGINMMTYNRCIGTRYCSNNCPYKVRRFNFFDYNSGTIKNLYTPNPIRPPAGELQRMQKNPDVTVRSRGVMEKCNYCVQRIEQARIRARTEGNRAIADGEIQTACQQACPTQAIVFGDLNDANSAVSKLQRLARSYGMLDPELNTRPRTEYLVKLRNPAGQLDAAMFARPEAAHGAGTEPAAPAGHH